MLSIRVVLPVLLLAGAGCGTSKYVPVSGTVTLNGQPLQGVMVIFQPVASGGTDAGGVGSSGRTGPDGRYTLEAMTPQPQMGALVGKHRVRIATPPGQLPGDDSDSATAGKKPPSQDPIPARYNVETTLTFDVPPGGTDKADFHLTAP